MPSPREIALVMGITCAGTAVAAAAILLFHYGKRRQKPQQASYVYSPGDFVDLQRRIELLERNIQYLQERLECRIQPTLSKLNNQLIESAAFLLMSLVETSSSVTTTGEEDFQEAFEYLISEESENQQEKL